MSGAVKILGGLALLWWGVLRGASALAVGLKSWQFKGINTSDGLFIITLNFLIKNPLIVGLTLKGVQGDIYVQGIRCGVINTIHNYYLSGGKTHQIPVTVYIKIAAVGSAIIENIKSGNVNNLTIDFDGKLLIGGAGVPLPVKFSYNWEDLTK